MWTFPMQSDGYGAAGAKAVKRKFAIGKYGHIALVTDTEGNMIGLHWMG